MGPRWSTWRSPGRSINPTQIPEKVRDLTRPRVSGTGRNPQATDAVRLNAFTADRPAHSARTPPSSTSERDPFSDCCVAWATVSAMAAPKPASCATRSGLSDEMVGEEADDTHANSAVGNSHRNSRYAIPPASKAPACLRSRS